MIPLRAVIDTFPSFLRKIALRLFDAKKKRDMNALYADAYDPWGRLENDVVIGAVELVKDRHYATCLDVGAGVGYFTEALVGVCESSLAIDISATAIRRASDRLGKTHGTIQFRVANIRTFEHSGTFSLIVLGDILYYLGDALSKKEFESVIAKIAHLLEDNGRILITHYVAPWRDERWLREVLTMFEARGLSLKRKKIVKRSNDPFYTYAVVLEKITRSMPHIGGEYEHYRGNRYRVIALAKHSETLEEMVVYQALYSEGQTWVRPAKMFLGEVEVGGKKVPRFRYIGTTS